tara:strand:+ start:1462 stop:2979 length:1518 start_codon:yes stop_codon:yes gene_type:complete
MFKQISEINNLNETKKFIEKIKIYICLIKIFLKKNSYNFVNHSIIDEQIKLRLNELNICDKSSQTDIKLLNKTLKNDLFFKFISSMSIDIKFRKKTYKFLENIDPSLRKLAQINNSKKVSPTIIDLFCGAGGLSLGFINEGFKVELANDNDSVCHETYRYNHPQLSDNKVILGDVKLLVNNPLLTSLNSIDVLVGGPPCQGYSNVNQQRIINDPRNQLYKNFVDVIDKIRPKFVVMENVKGMLKYAQQVKEDIELIGNNDNSNMSYDIGFKILVSDDFGIAQKRPRLFFIGIRKDVVKSKKISPEIIFNKICLENIKRKKHVLKDALDYIKPLKAPRVKNMTEVDDEETGNKIDINQFEGNENSYLKMINKTKIDLIFNHKSRYVNDVNYEIYSKLKQGEDSTTETIKHIMPYNHRSHIFKDKYYKLIEKNPSKTITAHLKMDCHSHIHPVQVRSITPREAARIQSFPDNYFFLGPYLKTYMQIGNAVPPLMASSIAKIIKKYLN